MKNLKTGFTLIEAMVALIITVGAIGLGMSGFIFMQKNQIQQLAQNQVDSETRMTTMRLQREMRLSSLTDMVFYPSTAKKYTAISFPLIQNGTTTRDADGKIVWDSTVVYHAKGSGNEMELLRTEFSPRDNTLSAAGRQNQLERVVLDGDGSAAANGENATTSSLFKNVFNWEIVPQGGYYDAYSDTLELDKEGGLGSFILTPGEHTLSFAASGKDSRSSGHRIGIDTLRISNSGLEREAEGQQVAGSPTPYTEENASGLWSGNHQLTFEPQNIGDSFTMDFYNDRWEDTNFDSFGNEKSNTVVGVIDTSYTPSEFTLKLLGNSTNWSAKAQSGHGDLTDDTDIGGENCVTNDFFKGSIIRVLLRGQDMAANGTIRVDPLDHDGAGCRIAFRASDIASSGVDLIIYKAYIDTCLYSNITTHTEGNPVQITFENGRNYKVIYNGARAWSDIIDFPISWEKSYAVTFWVYPYGTYPYPYIWQDATGTTCSYMIHNTNSPVASDLTATAWSSSRYTELPYIVGVEMLYTTYPEGGTYVSAPMDTLMDAPEFDSVDWSEDCPSGTQIGIKVRSANSSDMSDAPDWDSISAVPSPGSLNNIAYKRHVQYQATLESSGKGLATPKLRNFAIQWPGETRAVDIGGVFVNGPNHGQFETTIDGQPLSSPLRFSIELLKTVRGFNNEMETMTSKSTFELYPRNNGK